MALTLWIEPDLTQPIPANRPVYWEIRPDSGDVFDSTGFRPYVEIVWPGSPTVPANGTPFTIWGYAFEVQSGTAFTSNSFRVVSGNMAQTRDNFRNMLSSNFFFSRAVYFSVTGVDANILTVLWNNCRAEENFGALGMDLTAIESTGATVTVENGISPVPVEGHKIVTALLRENLFLGTSEQITPYEGVDTVVDCAFAYPLLLDFQQQISELLYTNIPLLTANSYDIPFYTTMYQYFRLQYGWVYREDCTPVSGDFFQSGIVKVWNGMIEDNDVYGIRKYYMGATGGLPPGQTYVKFLTNMPDDGMLLRFDSYAWLWFFVNKNELEPGATLKVIVNFLLSTGVGGTYSDDISNVGAEDGVLCVNASPMYVVDNTVAADTNLVSYTVKIYAYDGPDFVQITEAKQFYTERQLQCSENVDVYFRNRLGGIDTLPVIITEHVSSQTGNELNFQRSPIATTVERMTLRGRTITGAVNQRRFVIRAKHNWSEQWVDFFEAFRISTVRHIQTTGEDGLHYARKIVIEPGNITIWKEGEFIELEASGYYAHDTSAQSTAESIVS